MTIIVKKRKKKLTRDDIELTLLTIPTFIWYIIFSYLPMFGLILAFKDYKPIKGHNFMYNLFKSEWVGFTNFDFMFKTKDATIFLRNTILYNVVFIILGMLVAVTLAIMISELVNRRLAKIIL